MIRRSTNINETADRPLQCVVFKQPAIQAEVMEIYYLFSFHSCSEETPKFRLVPQRQWTSPTLKMSVLCKMMGHIYYFPVWAELMCPVV